MRGPFRSVHGWVVFEMESKQQTEPTLEGLDPQTLNYLRSEAAEMGRERVLAQYTDSLRKALAVRVFPERLQRVPWPVPPAPK